MTVYEAINKVMSECGAIGKNSTNKNQGFAYRGIDDILNVISPLLQKHGLMILPIAVTSVPVERVTTTNGASMSIVRLKVDYNLYTLDGSGTTVTVPAEAMDSGDKATAKAMSVALRTLLIQVFALATGEPDADAESHTVRPVAATSEWGADPWATNQDEPAGGYVLSKCKHGDRKQWTSPSDGAVIWYCPLPKGDPNKCEPARP